MAAVFPSFGIDFYKAGDLSTNIILNAIFLHIHQEYLQSGALCAFHSYFFWMSLHLITMDGCAWPHTSSHEYIMYRMPKSPVIVVDRVHLFFQWAKCKSDKGHRWGRSSVKISDPVLEDHYCYPGIVGNNEILSLRWKVHYTFLWLFMLFEVMSSSTVKLLHCGASWFG